MDIKRLEAFRKVYELGSFSKAGQELFLSQPTISAHVLSLEQELGTQLFDRLGRTILPTQAGDILHRHAVQVFAALESASAEIALLRKRVAGILTLGASTIPATYLLPERLAAFAARYPDVRIKLAVGDSQEITDGVLQGRLSLGVVGAKVSDPDLEYNTLVEDELVVAASPGLKGMRGLMDQAGPGGEPVIRPSELPQWPWVLREQGSGTRKALELALSELGLDIRSFDTAIEAKGQETVTQCALHGLGLCVTSRLVAARSLAKGELVQVAVPGLSMRRSFSVVRHARRQLYPAVRAFIDSLTSNQGQ